MAELTAALIASAVTWAAMSAKRQGDITTEIFTRLNRLETATARLEERSLNKATNETNY